MRSRCIYLQGCVWHYQISLFNVLSRAKRGDFLYFCFAAKTSRRPRGCVCVCAMLRFGFLFNIKPKTLHCESAGHRKVQLCIVQNGACCVECAAGFPSTVASASRIRKSHVHRALLTSDHFPGRNASWFWNSEWGFSLQNKKTNKKKQQPREVIKILTTIFFSALVEASLQFFLCQDFGVFWSCRRSRSGSRNIQKDCL